MMPSDPLYLGQVDITGQGPCTMKALHRQKIRQQTVTPPPSSPQPFLFVSGPMGNYHGYLLYTSKHFRVPFACPLTKSIWRAIIVRVLRSPNVPDILRYTMNPAPRLTAFTQPLTQRQQRRTKMIRKILQTQTHITLQHWQIL